MSRIGKKELTIPQGVNVNISNNISVKGPKGELTMPMRDEIDFKVEGDKVSSTTKRNDKFSKSI
ncbi:MAG: 50S ribosomal protein L6 [Candidatus Pacebacteria bacterium]|nr:50S ribosomal protein L6 [Candidatus Paceibacterota bacterium]